MSSETAFIAALRTIATSPAARGLTDDAAVLDIGNSRLVLTMDAIVEGVHFLANDPPDTIAWKLVATNVSDLAAKGALPKGCLLSYPLADDKSWNTAFLAGLDAASRHFNIPLLGGDTVRQPLGSARSFSLVAFGEPLRGVPVPSRAEARRGDQIWISGVVGDAGLGLALLRGERRAERESYNALVAAYRQPRPNPALGIALAPHVSAMMDVSDGVLIDMQRLAEASGVAAVIDLNRLALSSAYTMTAGDSLDSRIFAASAGDDYCLLLAAPPRNEAAIRAAATAYDSDLHCIGQIDEGHALTLLYDNQPIPLPAHIGFEH